MPTRTIATKVAIKGESEYRAALSRINTELKTLQSALKLTESQYQTNANSMTALKAKGEALNNLYTAQKNKVTELRNALENAKSAEAKYAQQKAELQAKIDANNKALEALKKTAGDTSAEEARLNAEHEKLKEEMAKCDAAIVAAEKGVNNWQTQLNNAEIRLNDLNAEVQKNKKYVDEAAKSADGCATSIDNFGKEVDDTGESLKGLGTILASEELIEFSKKVLAVVGECTNAYSDFESQMAGVRRTTGMSVEELGVLGNRFKELSTEIPITTEQLATIATTAGQLGIAKENVEGFTVVMAQLATTTDLTADMAATMLAQFANITGIKTQEEYERLGSAVAALGDSTATTASKVVDMSQGMAAAASQAGMSATDTLALSAAVGSLGIEAAAGSTAMSTLIQTLYKATQTGGDKLKQFASIAGMSAQEFRVAWETDAAGALNAFVQGLNDTERNGRSAILLLEDLGITNVRQTKAILGLAEAEGLLSKTLETGRTAWDENTALQDKAAIMYDTLSAKTKQLDSSFNNLKIAVGASLAPAFGDLAEKGTEALDKITEWAEKNPEFVASLTTVVTTIAAVTTGIAAAKAAYKALDFLGMSKGLKAVEAAFVTAGGGVGGFVAALSAIAAPAAIAVTAIASIASIAKTIKDVNEAGFIGDGHSIEEYAKNVDDCKAHVEELKDRYDELAASGADLTEISDELSLAQIAVSHAEEELKTATEAATEATEAATEATNEYATTAEEQAAINESIVASIDEIAQAYREAYEACLESLEGQIGLFDSYTAEISEDTDTAKEMLDLWAEQTANLAAYTENLKKAAQYGLDDGLVASLADGSTESAGYLQTIISEIENCDKGMGSIASSSEEAVNKFNENFARTEEAKGHLAETMAAIQTDLQGQLEAIEQTAADVNFEGFWDAVRTSFEGVGIEFNTIGLNLGIGLSEGISGSSGDVKTSATQLANDTTNAAKEAFGEHSPSAVWHEIGENLDIGLKEGITAQTGQVTNAAKLLAQQLQTQMSQGANQSVVQFTQQFSRLPGQAGSILSSLSSTVTSMTSGLPGAMYSVGAGIVDGMTNGILGRCGNLYSAISSVVSSAIARARSAAGVNSPSKLTRKIFEEVGEGMIVGIESKKEKVSESTKKVVDKALSLDTSSVQNIAKSIRTGLPDLSQIIESGGKGNSYTTHEGNVELHVAELIVREEADIDKIADSLYRKLRKEKRKAGITA